MYLICTCFVAFSHSSLSLPLSLFSLSLSLSRLSPPSLSLPLRVKTPLLSTLSSTTLLSTLTLTISLLKNFFLSLFRQKAQAQKNLVSLHVLIHSGPPHTCTCTCSSQISQWLQVIPPWLLISARSSHFYHCSVYNLLNILLQSHKNSYNVFLSLGKLL